MSQNISKVWLCFSGSCLISNMNPIKRGAMIVIEGVDRSGKSTQCRELVKSLNKRGLSSELMVFPDRSTHTGCLISEYLSNKECKLNDKAIHLLFSANRWENADKMQKLLFQGMNLIVDRYSYSGMAFSAAKKDMELEWCKQPETGLPKPDLVFLLTLSDEEMQKRPGFGDERYENVSMQNRVSSVFRQLADESWKIVNAKGTPAELQEVLLADVLKTIEQVANRPLAYLDFNTKNGWH